MADYTTTVDTPLDPADAFAYLADFSNVAEWDPGVREASRAEAGPVAEGSRFDVTMSIFGRASTLTYRVMRYTEPELVELQASNALLESHDVITVEPWGSGSRVTYHARVLLRGPLAVLDPLLRLAFKPVGDRAAAGLRDALKGTFAPAR